MARWSDAKVWALIYRAVRDNKAATLANNVSQFNSERLLSGVIHDHVGEESDGS